MSLSIVGIMMNRKQRSKIRKTFFALSPQPDGHASKEDLSQAFVRAGIIDIDEEELDHIFRTIDFGGLQGLLTFNEFCVAALSVEKHLTNEIL